MNPLVQRIGWMLIHSVWEDLLIWVILQIALIALARKSPQARYLAACMALAAMAGLPWLTFDAADISTRLHKIHSISNVAASPAPPASRQVFVEKNSQRDVGWEPSALAASQPVPARPWNWMPSLVAIWMTGLIFSSMRLWVRWRGVQTLVSQPASPLDAAWRERFTQLVQLSGVRHAVRLGEMAAVSVPIVAGWLKPVILLPLGVAASLPAEQVEAILLHELAHISRHDYLINLLQSIVETIFFYHPAVWSVSRRIRAERELACDDRTIQWCKSPRIYAEALAGFEEYRARSPLLAATGEGDLFVRIRRILLGRQPERRGLGVFTLAGFCGIGIYFASMFLVPVLAERVMTAEERVTQIKALQPPVSLQNPDGPGENVFVTGTIKTEDGQPVPRSLREHGSIKQSEALITSFRVGVWSSGGLDWDYTHDPSFYATTVSGNICIGIWAEGYAPLRATGLEAKKGKLTVDLVLKRGFPGIVQITGSNGQPLKDAIVTAISSHAGEPLETSMPSTRSDASGLANFGNVESDSEIHLVISKPGWQMADRIVSKWSDKSPLVCKLEPAISTSGFVIDQITRKPIPDAEITLAARRYTGDLYQAYAPEKGEVLGRSDQNGRFELENLATGGGYRIYVRAKGYPADVFPIEYGEQNRICELSQGLHLRGKILDPKKILQDPKLHHPIQLQCMYSLQATPFNSYGQEDRQSLTKAGTEIPFYFDHLPKGHTSLVFANFGLEHYWYELDLEKDVDDYIIDLGAIKPTSAAVKPATRAVEITLKSASGALVPTGTLEVDYQFTPGNPGGVATKSISMENGMAKFDLPIPNTATVRPDRIIGYWFEPATIAVQDGTGPVAHVIDAIPAGVIHGTVTFDPALGKRAFAVSSIVIQKPVGIKNLPLTGYGQSTENSYVTTPLPFGGTYATIIDAGPSYFVSSPAFVDAEHPLVIRNMEKIAAHETLTGKFVDENNKPITYQEVMLTYHPTPDNTLSSHPATTGADGNFTITGMNFAVPGDYEVQLYGNDWEPTQIRIDGHTPQPVTIPLRHKSIQPQ